MISWVTEVLADPIDGTPLAFSADNTALHSESGRSFALVPPGYMMLTPDGAPVERGDSGPQVAARETFLSRGHLAPVVEAVTDLVVNSLEERDLDTDTPVTVLDAGAGCGYYLAHTLDEVEQARGIGLDGSTSAATLLSEAHPRLAAVVADLGERLPLLDGSVDIITTISSPGDLAEFERVLAPGGRLILACTRPGHLAELSEIVDIASEDFDPGRQLCSQARERYGTQLRTTELTFEMNLDRDSIINQLTLNPVSDASDADELAARLDSLADNTTVTADIAVMVVDKPA